MKMKSLRIYFFAIINALYLSMFDAFFSGVLHYAFPFWYYYVFLNLGILLPAVIWSVPLLDAEMPITGLVFMVNVAGLYLFMNAVAVWGYDGFLLFFNPFLWHIYITESMTDLGAGMYLNTAYYFLDAEIEFWFGVVLLYYARKWGATI